MLKLSVLSSSVKSSSPSSFMKPVDTDFSDLLRAFPTTFVTESRFFRSVFRQV